MHFQPLIVGIWNTPPNPTQEKDRFCSYRPILPKKISDTWLIHSLDKTFFPWTKCTVSIFTMQNNNVFSWRLFICFYKNNSWNINDVAKAVHPFDCGFVSTLDKNLPLKLKSCGLNWWAWNKWLNFVINLTFCVQ